MAIVHVASPSSTDHDTRMSGLVDGCDTDVRDANAFSLDARLNRARNQTPAQAILRRLQLVKYRYEVTFGLYVMTAGEKILLNIIVVLCLALMALTLFVYLPHVVARIAKRFSFYYWGSPEKPALTYALRGVLQSSAVFSNGIGRANATAATLRLDL